MKTINAKQLRTVTILVRYTVRATGTVILHVENDAGVRYFCTLNENGTQSCSCPATKECYHLKAVIKVETARKAEWTAYRAALAKQLAAQYITTQVVEQVAEQLVAPKAPVRKVIAQAVEAKVPATDLSKKGNLNTGQGFRMMR
jgi:hypothetical protein